MEALAKAYQTHNLPVSAQTLKEVEWLHENYYGRKDKASSSVKCRLQRFSTVCERISSIRSLPLQKVAFQRHFAKTQFVGELLAEDSDASPPYLRHSKLQLLCTLPSLSSRGLGQEPESDDFRAADLDADKDKDATFFVEVGGDCGTRAAGSSATTRSYGQWDLPDLASLHASDWREKCPVISATDVIEIVSKPGAKPAWLKGRADSVKAWGRRGMRPGLRSTFTPRYESAQGHAHSTEQQHRPHGRAREQIFGGGGSRHAQGRTGGAAWRMEGLRTD